LPAVATYEQIVEANRATFAAWNAHDPDAVAAVFAPDAVIRDAIRQRAADMLVAFPDFRLRQLDLVVGENANADRWEVTATHSGPFLGMEATRQPGAGRGSDVQPLRPGRPGG